MKKIGRFFTNPTVISIIGLLLIGALIWFGGPYVKFGENNTAPLGSAVARLVAILVVVAIWGLNNLRVQHKNKKANKALADDLQQNEPVVEDATSGQTADELHQINQRFSEALGTLNKLRFRSKGKQRALYELPWYIIIGPPGSGKTTALVNSGLEFPLRDKFGQEALQGIGGTRNCDWWFTNEAVLIDTAGRYTTQDSHRVVDSSAWEGFLGLLKRHRKRRPINGAIVAISLHDLLLQTEDERVMHAQTIRARLDELMSKLEIRFPVYLMFTKADLVSGFSEFFEDLGKEERDQVWGVSLPNASSASQTPNFEFLSQELRKLVGRLYDRVLWRMHQERDTKRCGAIQGFPQQMENLVGIMDAFVKKTFAQNRFEQQPYLRGVYLSSGTQDGTPIDRMMSSVAANFGISADASYLPPRQGKSFFITRLLQDVIFPEAELVGANERYERLVRWSRRAAYGGLAGLAGVVLLGWSGSLAQHKSQMNEVATDIDTFKAEKQGVSRWNSDVRAVLPALDALAQASTVYDREAHPWLSGIGLYDGRIDSNADSAYQAQLVDIFLPRLLSSLEKVLTGPENNSDIYNTFRVYMMFGRTQHMDKTIISDWFTNHWDMTLHGETARRDALKQHLAALLMLELKPADLNPRVVQQTRQTILRLPVAQRVYSRLKSQPQNSQQVNLMSYFGDGVRNFYQVDEQTLAALSIPAMYTIEGYRRMDFSAESPLVADVANERWILSDDPDEKIDFGAPDLAQISEDVKKQYMSDYIRSWSNLYRSLTLAKFNSLRQAGEVLGAFSDPVYSPLRAVLDVGISNTQLTPVGAAADAAKLAEKRPGRVASLGEAVGFAAGKVEGTPVDQYFRDVHMLVRESAMGAPPVNNIMERIKQLEVYVREVTLAPDPDKAAFNIAKARFESGQGNPITALRTFATTLPDEPVGRWLTRLADETWRVMLVSARRHINSEWQAKVYSEYSRALANRYPLNRSATNEVALYDFTAFFKPEGTLDSFYREYVEPFIERRGQWQNRVVDRYTVGLSNDALNQIQRAQKIRAAFFKNSAETPGVELELRPYQMDKSDTRFVMDMGSQRITYNHGPKFWTTVHWSGANTDQRIRLVFEDINGGTRDKMYTGSWAWFRMLDDAQLKQAGQSNIYFITMGADRGDGKAVVYEARTRSVNSPFDASLLSNFRCPETL